MHLLRFPFSLFFASSTNKHSCSVFIFNKWTYTYFSLSFRLHPPWALSHTVRARYLWTSSVPVSVRRPMCFQHSGEGINWLFTIIAVFLSPWVLVWANLTPMHGELACHMKPFFYVFLQLSGEDIKWLFTINALFISFFVWVNLTPMLQRCTKRWTWWTSLCYLLPILCFFLAKSCFMLILGVVYEF